MNKIFHITICPIFKHPLHLYLFIYDMSAEMKLSTCSEMTYIFPTQSVSHLSHSLGLHQWRWRLS